jgi:hypothetical protein
VAFKPFKQVKVIPPATSSSTDTQTQITALQKQVSELTKALNTLQTNIAEALSQVLGKDALDVAIVKNVVLLPGVVNKVSHTLGRKLQGWKVIRNHGSYSLITDVQDTNKSPNLLLYLTTPVQVTVDLEVY